LKEICRQEAPTLVKELIRLATSAKSEAVRVARKCLIAALAGQLSQSKAV
jgi:hypothetical protein